MTSGGESVAFRGELEAPEELNGADAEEKPQEQRPQQQQRQPGALPPDSWMEQVCRKTKTYRDGGVVLAVDMSPGGPLGEDFHVDDEVLIRWCGWARDRLGGPRGILRDGGRLSRFDVSSRRVGDAGVKAVVELFLELSIDVDVLSLHHNRLNAGAADALAEFLKRSYQPVKELHVSHNELGTCGIVALLLAAAEAPNEVMPRRPKYPTLLGQGPKPLPLWMRLEHNGADLPPRHEFLRQVEDQMLQLRRKAGWLKASQEMPMICEADSDNRQTCNSRECGSLKPVDYGFGSKDAGGPVVHAPWLFSRRDAERTSGYHSRAERPHRSEPSSQECKNHRRGLCRFGSQCRFLHAEAEAQAFAGASAAAIAAQSRLAQERAAGTYEGKVPGRASRLAHVAREVVGPGDGWDGSNWLYPLCPGDIVQIVYYPEEAQEPGYVWAKRPSQKHLNPGARQYEDGAGVNNEGWLACSALEERHLQ